jgi:hypothetical protein
MLPESVGPGMKMIFELAVLAIDCIASRYLICMAGALLKMSAACLILFTCQSVVRWDGDISFYSQFGGFNLSASGDNLGLSSSLGLCSHGKRVLQFPGKDDVLDEHGFDFDTPAQGGLLDDFADGLCNFLATLDDILKDTRTNDMAQRSLGSLNKSLADVADTESSLVWRRDAVVDDRRQIERHVVLGHADLLGHLDNLNLDIDLDEILRERVDIDETWVDSALEATELGDQTDVSLVHWLVWVRAHETTGNRSESADAAAQCVNLLCG